MQHFKTIVHYLIVQRVASECTHIQNLLLGLIKTYDYDINTFETLKPSVYEVMEWGKNCWIVEIRVSLFTC